MGSWGQLQDPEFSEFELDTNECYIDLGLQEGTNYMKLPWI